MIVFWPLPVDRPTAGEIREAGEVVRQAGATAVSYSRVEIASNVLLFVPLGVLAFPRVPWWLVPVGCLVLSILIELTQFVLLADRFASIVDGGANVVGAILGAVLVRLIRNPAR